MSTSMITPEIQTMNPPVTIMTLPPPRSGFLGHIIACIIGAGLDNLFRQVAIVALAAAAVDTFPSDKAQADKLSATYGSWALMLFSAPFILLAPLAGSLGDRLPKHRIIRAARIADIPIAALGILGFAIESPALMLTALTLLAIASTFFAPVKLAVIPELVEDQRLSQANGIVAAVTVLAILGGTILAICTDNIWLAYLCSFIGIAASPHATVWSLAIISGILCTIGVIAAYRIPPLPAQAPHTPIAMPWMVVRQIQAFNHNPGTWVPALALAGFWALGGAAFAGLSTLGHVVYGLSEAGTVGLFLALVVGMVIGSILAPRLITKAFPSGAPLVGALIAGSAFAMVGLTAWYDMSLAENLRSPAVVLGWLVVTGIGAGLWEVPVTVLLQQRAAPLQRNLVMSAVSVLGSLGTFIAAGAFQLLVLSGLSTAQAFLCCGIFTVVSALIISFYYRKQVAGWLLSFTVKLAYKVSVHGAEHLPTTGGCLVVCNHLSYSDGVILASHLPRPGRFLVYRQFVDMPVVGLFMRAAGVIPVAAEDSRRALLASIDAAVGAAQAGEVVVIFPEGKLTRSGQMDSFRSGLERIARRAHVPVVPAHLDGLWGTITSRAASRSWLRPFRSVSLRLGSALPSTTTAAEARHAVMELSYQTAQARANKDARTLGSATLTSMRRHPRRIAVRDAGGVLPIWQLVALARILIRRLCLPKDEKTVGVLLPPGRSGSLVNLALTLSGHTAINLNHTVGNTQLQRMCELANIRTIISAKPYLKRLGDLELKPRVALLDEIMATTSKIEVVIAAVGAYLKPIRWLDRAQSQDVATVIFSSGSTGDPKGVELTHQQLLANIRAVSEGLELNADSDVVLSPLPLFHSFGLVPGFWLGLTLGIPVASQPDPTDAKALGKLAESSRATFLLSTPTFIRNYLRRIEPEQFRTLRFAVAGAERCPVDLKEQFLSRFGATLLEGYGCTELAPVVSLNLLPLKRDGVNEVRHRDGSVGRPLPGLHIFTVDPETFEPLPVGAIGLLVVRSASRMRSYLNRNDLTEKAFMHGGYNTGDIGHIDSDGFVHITGRLARFAKIGGEMVPLDHVEIAVQAAVLSITHENSSIEIAVAAVSDSSRGERLLVLHTGFSGDWEKLLGTLDQLPSLWRPRARDVHQVDLIPKLGTGKRDLAAIKTIAASLGA
jgi:acyl-[acyl-carrier-protein]-phospholipid O-acyltransferase / long-chain-fatty-acid--[acyl-carrier-protein] ligase